MKIFTGTNYDILIWLFLAWLFTGLGVSVINEERCLERGFDSAKTTVTYKGYCVRKFGQITEVEKL